MSKPKFDPSKPYSAVDKPKFDPTQPFSSGSDFSDSPGFVDEMAPDPSHEMLGGAGASIRENTRSEIASKLPEVGGFLGSFLPGPMSIPGAALGGSIGESARQITEAVRAFPGQSPDIPPTLGRQLKANAIQAGTQGAGAALGYGVSQAISPVISSVAKKLRGPIGSAIDTTIGVERGAGQMALEHPEITEPGYFNVGRIKNFVDRLSTNLKAHKEDIKGIWTSARDRIDNSVQPQIDRLEVRNAIQDVKDAFGLKAPEIKFDAVKQPLDKVSSPLIPEITQGRNALGAAELSEIAPAGETSFIDKASRMVKSTSHAAGVDKPETNAIFDIQNTFDDITQPDIYGNHLAKPKLGLKDLTELRKKVSDKIDDFENPLPDFAQAKLRQLYGKINSLIDNVPEYGPFRETDAKYQDMQGALNSVEKAFGIKPGRSSDKLTYQEMKTIEQRIRSSLKKGDMESEALRSLDEKIGGGSDTLLEAQKLAAAGGAQPANYNQFERPLRRGAGFLAPTLGGLAAGGAVLTGDNDKLKSIPIGLAAMGATAAMTSPRMAGLAIREGIPAAKSFIGLSRRAAQALAAKMLADKLLKDENK